MFALLKSKDWVDFSLLNAVWSTITWLLALFSAFLKYFQVAVDKGCSHNHKDDFTVLSVAPELKIVVVPLNVLGIHRGRGAPLPLG